MHSGSPCSSSCASDTSCSLQTSQSETKSLQLPRWGKKKKNYDTHTLHTNMVHTREAKHAETFLWIDLDGRSILPRSAPMVLTEQTWETLCGPRVWPTCNKQTGSEANVGHSALTRQDFYEQKGKRCANVSICFFIWIILWRNMPQFIVTVNKSVIKCYLSVVSQMDAAFLDVNHFLLEEGSGQAAAKPLVDKCFMWPRQFVLLRWGRKMGATKNRSAPFRFDSVSISPLPTAVKLLPVGGSEAPLKRVYVS